MNLHAEILVIGALAITGWKLIGWTGALCFSLRWGVQVWHRARTRESSLPRSFWWISVVGASMALAYFLFGQQDSVGVLQNALPLALAIWNLSMDRKPGNGSSEPA
jgi:lipid-A-disaccharide synthase-like uncharacterized protein